ncbi:hypothetical protein [[Eubacterium] cellulosolvens]
MSRSHKFLIPTLLFGLLIIGLGRPVTGQLGPPKLMVYPSSITTNVSTEFSIDIWLTDIPENNRMEGALIVVGWFRSDMEKISEETNEPGSWDVDIQDGSDLNKDYRGFDFAPKNGIAVTEDRRWVTITFHCLEAGVTTISIEGQALMATGTAAPELLDLDPIEVTVNQVAPVGGISTTVNKLEILAPYIALAGLIAAVSAVYVFKKHKE